MDIILPFSKTYINIPHCLKIILNFIVPNRLRTLLHIGVTISSKDLEELSNKPETMVQFLGMDCQNDNLYVFIMKIWYKGFYTSFSSVELNKKDDDIRMNVLINDLHGLKSYDYINVV